MRHNHKRLSALTVLALLIMGSASLGAKVQAAPNYPPQQEAGSVGLEGTISTAPPKQGATITTPGNGASFTSLPVTVNGLCPTGLLVKVFSNNVFVGSLDCKSGNYSMQIDLFSGQNQLVAKVYDALDQPGPDSNVVTVTFNDPRFTGITDRLFLTSVYAQRGASPGNELTWPIIMTGGTGPYAISVDWGDGSPTDLVSQQFAGNFTIKHTYKTPGVYKIIVKATDSKGDIAILQLSGVSTGAITSGTKGSDKGSLQVVKTIVIWWPVLLMLPLIVSAFWLGKRSELYTLRKRLDKSRKQGV